MITLIKIVGVFAVLGTLTLFMPVVTALPLGMDEALTFFVGNIRALVELLPWMELPFTLIMWALFIKSLLFAWHWIKWFIELIRG